jgi:hypothetical protein
MIEECQENYRKSINQAILEEINPEKELESQFGLRKDEILKTIDKYIQEKIEEKFASNFISQSSCKCAGKADDQLIKSSEYRIDGSMILQNSNAEVKFDGMTSEKFESNCRQEQRYYDLSKLNSKVFEVSPEESYYSDEQNFDQKENISNGMMR